MNTYSVSFEISLKGADQIAMFRQNPRAFSNIHAAILFVIEAVMTGSLPRPLVPLVDGVDSITLPCDFSKNRRAKRIRYEIVSGATLLCMGVRIYFVDKNDEVILEVEAVADSQGIRYIREAVKCGPA